MARKKRTVWTPAKVALLGTMNDSELARRLSLGTSSVWAKRTSLGISPFPFPATRIAKWSAVEIKLLREIEDDLQIARMTGKMLAEVKAKRKSLEKG